MRKRIWRMSEDKFDNKKAKLLFSSNPVVVSGTEGEKLQGEFSFHSADGSEIGGVVYSSNPYVRIPKPQFSGTDITIRFAVRGEHYVEGDEIQGYFTIISNGGEYRLPFAVHFSTQNQTSPGEITSPEELAELAKGHWNKAMQLFYSDKFEGVMKRQESAMQLLYRGYRKALPSPANFEEFLVTAGLKKSVSFSVKERQETFYHITENRKETLLISKSNWGYIEISVTSDNDFVTVENEKITSDFFLGSTMFLNYYIHKNRMHAGKNYARITFSCKGRIQTVDIMATFDYEDASYEWSYRQKKRELLLLMQTYEKYRFRRITTGDWCEQSVRLLEDLLREDENNAWYHLMKAHCYIVNKQRQEALWIIQDMKHAIGDKTGVEWAYLLYLCTLIEKEEAYVDRLTKEIEVIFRKHPEDARIFWFLSFLRTEYVKDSGRKLKAIRQWMEAGNNSPFFYIEAAELYLQNPYLLYEFSDFSVRILYWICKKGLLTKDIAMQISHVLAKHNAFSEKIWFLATSAYEIYPQQEFLSQMLSFLLRNQMYQERFLPWYRLGVCEDLRLSGLYEAYVLSMPDESTEEIPQKIVLYFQYSCNLPYQKKALLFANIITNRRSMPQVYEMYLRSIERFAIEQMKLNRINDNLAIVYQNVLEMGVVDETMAAAASGLVFMKKLVCLYPDVIRVFLYQDQYEMPVVMPVHQSVSYLPVVSENFQVFMETRDGVLISDKVGYTLQNLMYPKVYIQKLKNLSPLSLPYILSDFCRKKSPEMFSLEDIQKIDTFLHAPLVSRQYIVKMYKLLIPFLRNYCREEMLEKHFLDEVDYSLLDKDTMGFVLSLFLSHENYEKAYALMKAYYGLQVDMRLLCRMCDFLLKQENYRDEEFLYEICEYAFENDGACATPDMLQCLSERCVGPTEWMLRLWESATEAQLRVTDLEANLLFQGLYAQSHLREMMPVFASYMTYGRDKVLTEAFINYWSHAYMLSSEEVPEQIFTYLAYYFDKGVPLKESCNLAYMKFLSSLELLSEREFSILDRLLRHYILRNVYFSFYKNVDKRLIVKYHLYDKCFVEYRGNPAERITIVYQYDEKEPVEEEMTEMYEGIFVKQFVLFFGETVSYEIYAEQVNDLPVIADKLVLSSQLRENEASRYELLNRMQNEMLYNEREALAGNVKRYQGLEQVTETLFTTI